MLALSVRQPWAWLIIHAGKPIENRDWYTRVRGRVLIHASKGMTRDEYDDACAFAHHCGVNTNLIPLPAELQRGGIIGSVEIIDCVTVHSSPWFVGFHGFVLRDPRPLPFRPYKGQLGFFEVLDA
ncbi:MAG: ASCH domain-containing protein [Burkholderiales bacterium]|nr:ASCH domain-containing protein [Burkholderiales bacterium]